VTDELNIEMDRHNVACIWKTDTPERILFCETKFLKGKCLFLKIYKGKILNISSSRRIFKTGNYSVQPPLFGETVKTLSKNDLDVSFYWNLACV
jgi:hypothetical protein